MYGGSPSIACLLASFSQKPKSAETICPTSRAPSTKATIPATTPATGIPALAMAPATPAVPSAVAAAAAADAFALATWVPTAWADISAEAPAAASAEAFVAPAAPFDLARISAACLYGSAAASAFPVDLGTVPCEPAFSADFAALPALRDASLLLIALPPSAAS